MMEQKDHTQFQGTYFDKSIVLRVELWLRIIAWFVLAVYIFEAGYNIVQSIYNALGSGYPVDFFFLFITFSKIFQGAVLFALLYAAAQGLLILLDVEDNTRRAARK
jgi:hypothetical protein